MAQSRRSARQYWRKLSGLIILLVLVISGGLTLFLIDREKDLIYRGKVRTAEIVLGYLANGAIIPLLEDDTLRLNTLVYEAKDVTGFAYAVIMDGNEIVKAQTDADIGVILKESDRIRKAPKDRGITSQTYTLPSGARVLNLSKPITFPNKVLGSVHLGLSLDLLNKEIQKETLPLIYSRIFLGLFSLLIIMGVALLLGARLERVPAYLESSVRKLIGSRSRPGIESSSPMNPSPSRVTRDQATTLFSGIKEFSIYAYGRRPEEILGDLNEYLAIAQNCILDYGGHVDKFVGGAVIGVFSSSSLPGDHTLRAVRAAVAIQQALGDSGGKGNPLLCRVGIGISSGVVLSGPAGSHKKNGYTFIGDGLRAAYALNVMATPGEILISKDLYQSVKNFVSVEPIPPREIKQRTEPWENFRLQRIVERNGKGNKPGIFRVSVKVSGKTGKMEAGKWIKRAFRKYIPHA